LISKRELLRFGSVGALLAGAGCATGSLPERTAGSVGNVDPGRIRAAASETVICRDRITQPVMLKSLDLLERGGVFMVRAEDSDGAVGWALTNERRFPEARAIFTEMVAPQFVGKEMRDYERHLEQVRSNRNRL